MPKDTPITRFSLNNVTELAKLDSPIIFEGLDPRQYTSEVADDFRHMARDALSLSILHKGIATSASVGKAVSYFVQISTLQNASTTSEGQATCYEQEQEQQRLAGPFGKSLQGAENMGYCRIHEVPNRLKLLGFLRQDLANIASFLMKIGPKECAFEAIICAFET